jgi:hypothetical protein
LTIFLLLLLNGPIQPVPAEPVPAEPLPADSVARSRREAVINRVDSLETAVYARRRFGYETEYMSRVVYAGRDFGVNQTGLNHQLSYETAHWTVYGKAYHWSGLPNPWAKYDLGASYHTSFFGEKLSTDFTYERWWYTNGTAANRRQLTNFTAAELEWDEDWAFLAADFYYMFGTGQARQANLSLGRYLDVYRVLGADKLEFAPQFTVMWATVGLTPLNTHVNRARRNAEPASDPFGLANYELSLPVTWKKLGRFEGTAAWRYDWPQRRLKGDINHPFSYVTVNLAFTLGHLP